MRGGGVFPGVAEGGRRGGAGWPAAPPLTTTPLPPPPRPGDVSAADLAGTEVLGTQGPSWEELIPVPSSTPGLSRVPSVPQPPLPVLPEVLPCTGLEPQANGDWWPALWVPRT